MARHDAGETQAVCTAATRTGARCRGRALLGQETCRFHDPALAAANAEARRAGGRASSHADRARTRLRGGASLALIEEALGDAMHDVLAGRLEPAAATAIAALARSLVVVRVDTREEARLEAATRPVHPTITKPPIDYREADLALRRIIAAERDRPPEA